MTRQKIALTVTGLYLLVAVFVLATFLTAPPDGLANIWVAIWTLPATLLGLGLLYYPFGISFPFVPSGGMFGYYEAHVIYFLAAVAVLSYLLYRLIRGSS